MTTGRAIMIGTLVAVLVIAVVGVLALAGAFDRVLGTNSPVDGPVIVALVLPNESGVQEPRVLDVYTRTPSGWAVASVSPSLPVVVSGTTGRTLADAYVYGGGAALAKAYSAVGKGEVASWVVADPAAWASLAGTTPITVDAPSAMEVFDGTRLMSFPAGHTTIQPTHTALLLVGAQYLPAAQYADVRVQVGDAVGERLATASASGVSGLRSDMTGRQLAQWLSALNPRSRLSSE